MWFAEFNEMAITINVLFSPCIYIHIKKNSNRYISWTAGLIYEPFVYTQITSAMIYDVMIYESDLMTIEYTVHLRHA